MGLVARLRSGGHILYLTLLILATSGGAYWLGFHNAATTAQLCQAGNEARAQQIGLWEYILSLSHPPPGETPAQRAQRTAVLAKFDAHLHRVFAARDCAAPRQRQGALTAKSGLPSGSSGYDTGDRRPVPPPLPAPCKATSQRNGARATRKPWPRGRRFRVVRQASPPGTPGCPPGRSTAATAPAGPRY